MHDIIVIDRMTNREAREGGGETVSEGTKYSVAWVAAKHILLRWNPPSGALETATVTSVPVLLFKMRCMFFFTVKTCLCALSEENTLPFSSLSAYPFLWRPLIFHMPCLVRLSFIFFLNGTIDSAISFRHSGLFFWLAKTSNKPISLTTWLAVTL